MEYTDMEWFGVGVHFGRSLAHSGKGRKIEDQLSDVGEGRILLDGLLGEFQSANDVLSSNQKKCDGITSQYYNL